MAPGDADQCGALNGRFSMCRPVGSRSPATEWIASASWRSSAVGFAIIVGSRLAGPTAGAFLAVVISTLCRPAAAIVSARFAARCPAMSSSRSFGSVSCHGAGVKVSRSPASHSTASSMLLASVTLFAPARTASPRFAGGSISVRPILVASRATGTVPRIAVTLPFSPSAPVTIMSPTGTMCPWYCATARATGRSHKCCANADSGRISAMSPFAALRAFSLFSALYTRQRVSAAPSAGIPRISSDPPAGFVLTRTSPRSASIPLIHAVAAASGRFSIGDSALFCWAVGQRWGRQRAVVLTPGDSAGAGRPGGAEAGECDERNRHAAGVPGWSASSARPYCASVRLC